MANLVFLETVFLLNSVLLIVISHNILLLPQLPGCVLTAGASAQYHSMSEIKVNLYCTG